MRTTTDQARDGTSTRRKSRRTQRSGRNERQENPTRRLQRRHGNQRVTRLVDEGVVQPKLEVGSPDDKYEREADRVAREVTRSGSSSAAERPASASSERVQRMCTRCQERYEAGKALDCPDCEKELQRKPDDGGGNVESAGLQSELDTAGGGRELPDGVRSTFESRIGHDFSGVRVHDGSEAAQLSDQLGAKAFTYGRDIYFGEGNYRPETRSGQSLLAHELTHVVQQTGAGPTRVQRQETEEEEGDNSVVTLCDRDFNMPISVPYTDMTIPAGDAVPARHCFVWYHDESVDAAPENIVQSNTSTYDPGTTATPDAAANDSSTVCRATYDIDPSCVRSKYQELCPPDEFNLATNNCCSCAHRVIDSCGGSPAASHFPSENHGTGLPEDMGEGWKRDLLEKGDSIIQQGGDLLERGKSGLSEGIDSISQWGSDLYEQGESAVSDGVEGAKEFGSDVRQNVEYMNSREFIFDMQRWLSGR